MRDEELTRTLETDELARVLRSEAEQILPSSGFVVSVMEAVRAEALAPPPIPFPWKRALPGLAAASAALVALIVVFVAQLGRAGAPTPTPTWWPQVLRALQLAHSAGTEWIFAALLLAFVSVRISMRLTSGRT
jgi:hypothetical protein